MHSHISSVATYKEIIKQLNRVHTLIQQFKFKVPESLKNSNLKYFQNSKL